MRTSSSCSLAAAMMLLTSTAVYAADKPSDPQIAHIAYTAGDLDIRAARLALEKSKNKAVRDFADNMVKDHSAVNVQALALVKKLNVTPEDNATSKGLADQAADKQAELAKLSGTVNAALETTLIPSASNAELKSFLQTGLKIFQGHEQHAEHLAATFK